MQISCKHEACRGFIKLFFFRNSGCAAWFIRLLFKKRLACALRGSWEISADNHPDGRDAFPSFAMRLRQTHLFFGLNLWLLLAAGIAHAQAPRPSEYQLKAAFLYNFAKFFIDWPPEAFKEDTSPFVRS